VAAQLERELHIRVEKIKAHYGEFKILVDGKILIDGGVKAVLGILPSGQDIVKAVRIRLSEVSNSDK
jgi:hypothetical protein